MHSCANLKILFKGLKLGIFFNFAKFVSKNKSKINIKKKKQYKT